MGRGKKIKSTKAEDTLGFGTLPGKNEKGGRKKFEPNKKASNLCIHGYHPAIHKEDSKHGQTNGTPNQK